MIEAKDREMWRAIVQDPSFLADKGPQLYSSNLNIKLNKSKSRVAVYIVYIIVCVYQAVCIFEQTKTEWHECAIYSLL